MNSVKAPPPGYQGGQPRLHEAAAGVTAAVPTMPAGWRWDAGTSTPHTHTAVKVTQLHLPLAALRLPGSSASAGGRKRKGKSEEGHGNLLATTPGHMECRRTVGWLMHVSQELKAGAVTMTTSSS